MNGKKKKQENEVNENDFAKKDYNFNNDDLIHTENLASFHESSKFDQQSKEMNDAIHSFNLAGDREGAKSEQDDSETVEITLASMNETNQLIADLEEKLAAAQKEVDDTKERMLRLAAEAENIRRRAEKEKIDAGRFGVSKLAKDLLDIADNLSRALASVPEAQRTNNPDLQAMLVGIELTNKMLQDCLTRHQILKVSGVGSVFSYDLHQAISQIESPDHASGTIVEVLQDGYQLYDRLLRAAMVIVAK